MAEPQNDKAIRAELLARIQAEHAQAPGTVFIEELGLCCGAVRVDVAVATVEILHGFEIKGETDSLKRLQGQVEVYSGVLDRATLVLHETHQKHAEGRVPEWWGLVVVQVDGRWDVRRQALTNPSINPRWLVESLWRNEAYEILMSRQFHRGMKYKPKHHLFDALVANLPLEELRFEVRTRIRTRPVWKPERRSSIGPAPWEERTPTPPPDPAPDPWVL